MDQDEVDFGELVEEDRALKEDEGGTSFCDDVGQLSKLLSGLTREIFYTFNQDSRLGDPENQSPPAPNITAQLADLLAAVYSTPPTRRLRDGEDPIDPFLLPAKELRRVVGKMFLDGAFAQADVVRQILRQCVIYFSPSRLHGGVVLRIFEPNNVLRLPSAGAGDLIDQDRRIAFGLRRSRDPERELWELWSREGEGEDARWRVAHVNGRGKPAGAQPYVELGGVSPFRELVPAVLFTDRLLLGRAWLPIGQHRLDLAKNVAALFSESAYVVKTQAHSQRVVEDATDPADVPDEVGPDRTWVLPPGAKANVLQHQAQLDAINATSAAHMSAYASSEGLVADRFSIDRKIPESSTAFKIANQDLTKLRGRQVPPSHWIEAEAYRKYSRVWNEAFDAKLDETLELDVTFAPTDVPVDRREHQEVAFRDISAGVLSPVRYVAESRQCTRETAIELIREAADDVDLLVEIFGPLADPAAAMPNAGAQTTGPRAALGPGSATAGPGFNPDPASSTEGASVVSAIRKRFMLVAGGGGG